MAEKRIKRPRDPVQLAKLIGDIATGATTAAPRAPKKKPKAKASGKKARR